MLARVVPVVSAAVFAAPRVAAAAAVLTAVIVLTGWIGDYPLLRSVLPRAVEMKANTAIGLLTAGMAMWLCAVPAERSRRWVVPAAVFLLLLGIATLLEYAFAVNLHIDEALFEDHAAAYNAHRGRMSPYTAGTFVALAIAFFTIGRRRARWLNRAATIVVLTTGVVSALGYVWNAQELVTDQLVPPVAINTALVMILLAVGMLVVDIGPAYRERLEHGQASVEGTIVLALVLTFVIFGAGASYTYRATAHFDASLADDHRLQIIRTELLGLERDFREVLGRQRIYLADDSADKALAYARVEHDVRAKLQTLTTLAEEGRVDAAIVASLRSHGEAYLLTLRQEVKALRSGQVSLREVLVGSPASQLRAALMTLDDPIEEAYTAGANARRSDARRLRQYTLVSMLMLLTLVAGVAVLIVRAVRREVRLTAETRRHDDLSRSILSLLASTRARTQAVQGTLDLACKLVPGATAAFYAAAGNGDFEREATTDPQSWESHFAGNDSVIEDLRRSGAAVVEPQGAQHGGWASTSPGRVWRTFHALVYSDEVLGLVALATPRALTASEQSFLTRKTAHLAVTLTNLKQLTDLSTLSDQLARKNEMLEAQARELERATRLKSEFLATMSHELRTPLNAIIGFADVLREGLAGELTSAQREYVGDILTSGEHLLALINDILDLSKVEAGKMELAPEPVDVDVLLHNAVTMVRERAQVRSIRIDVVLEPSLPVLHADSRRLKQICYNLLSNAVKFSHDGGSVIVGARQSAREGGSWIEISVSDTGIGISEADQARLFQPFVQADASLSKHYEGTGLGLVLVKKLTELHGGNVTVESASKVGSTFRVYLPVEAAAVPDGAVLAPLNMPTPSGDRPLALVVEDRDVDAEGQRLHLERCGFQVVRARSPDEALEYGRRHVPDLITVDVMLDGNDGWRLLEVLKRDPAVKRVPVIMISVVADARKGRALGAFAVLQKPVHLRELEAVCAAIERGAGAEPAMDVLVVDDDAMASRILGSYFESAGCCVTLCQDGASALAEARRAIPDLIALDLLMPDMSGFDVIAELASDPLTAQIPILVVTAKPLTQPEHSRLMSQTVAVLEKGSLRRNDLLQHVRALAEEV